MTSHATLNGAITATGGENPDQRGFEWGYSSGNYPYGWVEGGSFGTGAFDHQVTGLSNSTVYYYRAKAHNSAGWGYGNEQSFATPTSETSTSTTITANLKTPAGANYPGATVYFTTTVGSVNPTSAVTDANGNAQTTLSSAGSYGVAVVKATWPGDASVPACSAYCTVHIFYQPEVADGNKSFQFFCEGIEYAYVGGRYSLNELGVVNDFEVEIPEWDSSLIVNGYVNIYRLGVKEFSGILKDIKRSLSDAPRVTLKGPDVSALLNDRVVDTKIYSGKTPQYIINDLLTSFPCGISPGILASCAATLTVTVDTETLAKAIPRICGLVNWEYRVTLDRVLDFAESFTGGTAAAAFTEGVDIFTVDRDVNYTAVANYIRMRGSGIVSTEQDGTSIQQQGLHQAAAFNKSVTDQATLDAACQAWLDLHKTQAETIPFEAYDHYAPGMFGPEDYITVTSSTVGMTGTYQIRKITRDLTSPHWVGLDLSNIQKQLWQMDEQYRRMVKDVSVT